MERGSFFAQFSLKPNLLEMLEKKEKGN